MDEGENKPPMAENELAASSAALKLVLVYAIFACLWILFSDKAVAWSFSDPAMITLASMIKGWLFVVVTSLLLFSLIRRLLKQVIAASGSALEAQMERTRAIQLLASIADSSPDVIFAKDLEGRYLLINRETARVMGKTAKQALGFDDVTLFPSRQAERIRADDRRVIDENRTDTREETLFTADGERTYMAIKGPLRNEHGKVIGLFNISRDITKRKQDELALLESKALLQEIIEHSPLSMALVNMSGTIEYINRKAVETFGYLPQEIPDMDRWWAQAYPDQAYRAEVITLWMGLLQKALANRHEIERREYKVTCKDGSVKTATIFGVGVANKVLVIFEDVTGRMQAEEVLKASEEKYRALVETTGTGYLIIDGAGKVLDANPEYVRLSGHRELRDIVGRHVTEWTVESEKEKNSRAVAQCSRDGFIRNLVIYYVDANGQTTPVEINATAVGAGNSLKIISLCRDVTDRKQVEDQVRQLAFHDMLTMLPNRRLFNDRLSQAMATSKRSGCYCALMFLDLDDFKTLNDQYGHEVGDMLLVEAANRLKNCVREMDTVARFGGDEFVVMISDLGADRAASVAQARIVAEKIRVALSVPYRLTVRQEGKPGVPLEYRCSASIGVSLYLNHEATQNDILRSADDAMYEAKKAGRNSIRFDELNDGMTT
jgi:diguanylate cyclase (GGDEF)-like protein/PAS domain S-box-containing protein